MSQSSPDFNTIITPDDLIDTLRFDLSVEEGTIHIYHVLPENDSNTDIQDKFNAAFPVILS